MGTQLSKVLDECITQISNRHSINSCLAEYPAMSQQLEPLLRTASSIAALPKVSPSDGFRKLLKARLKVRLSENRVQAEAARPGRRIAVLTALSEVWQGLVHTVAVSRRVAIPVAVTLLLVLASALYIFWTPSLSSPTASLTSKCTLSILSGSVEWQKPGSTIWEKAQDGTTLEAGSWVRTDATSEALLTFFEGSTLELEAKTEVEIQRAEYTEEKHTIIILRQLLGRTWSRVVKMVDPGSQYEIQTPSASAIVRGTLFMTEVEESGSTIVQTVEGLVAVSAQTAPPSALTTTLEVNVPAGYGTIVAVGETPSQPTLFETPQLPDGQGSTGDNNGSSTDQSQGDEGQSQGDRGQGKGGEGQGGGGQGGGGQGGGGQGGGGQGGGGQGGGGR